MYAEKVYEKLEKIEILLEKYNISRKKILTFKEASAFLDIKESYLYQLTSKKQIPHYRPRGRKLYFKKSELESWILENRQLTTCELKSKAVDFITKNPTLKPKTTWTKTSLN